MSKLAQQRICVQKILQQHQHEIRNIRLAAPTPEHREKLLAAFYTKKIWPKGARVTIAFTDTGNQIPRTPVNQSDEDPLQANINDLSVQQAIRKIVRERIQPLVNLRLEFVDNPKGANVRIGFDPNGGCWSNVGTDCLSSQEATTMNFGWFDVATVIHEFGHLCGLVHEHQNPHGSKIMWNDAKVFAWAKETQGWSETTTEENIIHKYDSNSINGSDFDPFSIMLYFFPADLTVNNKGTTQNLRLSGYDVTWLNKVYPTDSSPTPSEFYQQVYNENIEDNMKKSEQEATQYGKPDSLSTIPWKTIGIVVLIIVLVIVIIKLVIKPNYKRRYGS